MNRELLSKAFGDIEERFVSEAYREPEAFAEAPKGKNIRKRILTVALAAALYVAVGAAVYAACTSPWLADYFEARQKAPLSPRQKEYLASESLEICQSATVDGYTVTVESAICDRMELCMVIRVEGPEGVLLDREQGGFWFRSIKHKRLGDYEKTGYIRGYATHGSYLADGDGLDNTAMKVLMTQRELTPDSNEGFTDGELWRVTLSGLFLMTGPPESWTDLAAGPWEFVLPLTKQSEELEMISSPVRCRARYGGEGKQKEPVEITVTSFVLRPLGASCEFLIASGYRGVELSEVYLVMKNGEKVPLTLMAGDPHGSMYYQYQYDAPILLDEVESLVLPDDVVVPYTEKK